MAKKTAGDSAKGEPLPDKFAVRIAVTRESMRKLFGEHVLDVGDHPLVEEQPDGTGMLLAYVPESQVKELQVGGYRVEVGENVSEIARQRQAEVGKGDRFEAGRVAPVGLGKKPGKRSGSVGPGQKGTAKGG